MNKELSELNKTMQLQLKKESSFKEGIETLLVLRNTIMDTFLGYKKILSREQFDINPFVGTKKNEDATIAFTLWHIFRIEDIVVNSLIKEDKQVFFVKEYNKQIGSSIITTGNELENQEISEFSQTINLEKLYSYIEEVKRTTEKWLFTLEYKEIKRKFLPEKKEYLQTLEVVSPSDDSAWLIDYWCGKTVLGLIQMPLSRHWIMHFEACERILDKIRR